MKKDYQVRAMCADYALDIPLGYTTVVLHFNSRNNAELVKAILEHEDAHPNEAVPFQKNHFCDDTKMISLTLEQLRKMNRQPVWYRDKDEWFIVELHHPVFGSCVINSDGCYIPLEKAVKRGFYAYPIAHIDREAWGPCKDEVLTNADRIRAMSDEELATHMWNKFGCPDGRNHTTYDCLGNSCKDCWLDWLRRPAKED